MYKPRVGDLVEFCPSRDYDDDFALMIVIGPSRLVYHDSEERTPCFVLTACPRSRLFEIMIERGERLANPWTSMLRKARP